MLNGEQLKVLSDAIGDSFDFDEMGYLLYKCVGDNKIAEIAAKSHASRIVARACLEQADKDGVTLPFLAFAVEMRKSNTVLRDTIYRSVPEVAVARPSTREAVNDIVKALYLANSLLDQPEVRGAIQGLADMVLRVKNHVTALEVHKTLHDNLHQLQLRRFESLRDAVDRIKAQDTLSIEILRDFQDRMLFAKEALAVAAARLPMDDLNTALQNRWIDKLGKAADMLEAALTVRDEGRILIALGITEKILEDEPTQLNSIIFTTASALPLAILADLLFAVAPAAGPTSHSLVSGAERVRTVDVNLRSRVSLHQLWQDADDFLRPLSATLGKPPPSTLRDFARMWPTVRTAYRYLCIPAKEEAWAGRALEDTAAIDDRLGKLDRTLTIAGVLTPDDMALLAETFGNFRTQMRRQFFQIDRLLLAECTALLAVSSPIEQILKRLKP